MPDEEMKTNWERWYSENETNLLKDKSSFWPKSTFWIQKTFCDGFSAGRAKTRNDLSKESKP